MPGNGYWTAAAGRAQGGAMIVITAPTGLIGHQVLADVLAGDEPVRVVVRDPAKLPAAVRDRVEVVTGSHGDPAVVDRAFTGADAVFFLPPPQPGAATVDDAFAGFARPAADAVARLGVPHVVGISALGRGTPVADRAGYVTATLAVDDLFAATGTAYRALTMPSFMDNVARQVVPIRDHGVLYGIDDPDRPAPTVATRDIAAVAAALLRDRSWTGQEERPVLGPEDLAPVDQVRIIGEVLGRPVRYERLPDAAWTQRMTGNGMSPAMAAGWVEMGVAKNAGLDGGVVRTAEWSTPTTFRRWCAEVLAPAVGVQPGTAAQTA
jgi:uncharacterized protein YbjT (DUF2867 family)